MPDNLSSVTAPLQLSPLQPFGVGGRRLCFVHPLDPAKCVKVSRQDDRRTVRNSRSPIPTRFRREYDNNAHELKILTELFQRVGPEARFGLPQCYGMAETDLGPGLVLDLVRDHDGRIARSLRELISTGHAPAAFRPAFEEFAAFLIRHAIVTRAILDHNLAAQDRGDGTWRLYLIDGLGDPAWFSLAQTFQWIARTKIERRVAAVWPRLERLAAEPVTPELIRQSTWGQGFLNHRGEAGVKPKP